MTMARGVTAGGSFESAEYAITETPDDPSRTPHDLVTALNPLDALDRYAVGLGYVRYTELESFHEWLGVDEHGLWGTFENTTIWAIPVEAPPVAVTAKAVEEFIGSLLSHDSDVLLPLVGISGPRAEAILAVARENFGGLEPAEVEPKAGVCGEYGPEGNPCLERLGHGGKHRSESHMWEIIPF